MPGISDELRVDVFEAVSILAHAVDVHPGLVGKGIITNIGTLGVGALIGELIDGP